MAPYTGLFKAIALSLVFLLVIGGSSAYGALFGFLVILGIACLFVLYYSFRLAVSGGWFGIVLWFCCLITPGVGWMLLLAAAAVYLWEHSSS